MSIFGNNHGSHDEWAPKEVIKIDSSGKKQYVILEEVKRGPCAEKTTVEVDGGFDYLLPWLEFKISHTRVEVHRLPANCDPALLMLLRALL